MKFSLAMSQPEGLGLLLVFCLGMIAVAKVTLGLVHNRSIRDRVVGHQNWLAFSWFIIAGTVGAMFAALMIGSGFPTLFIWLGGLIGVGVGALITKWLAAYVPFSMPCPHCKRSIPWDKPWICGSCGDPGGHKKQSSGVIEFLTSIMPDPFDGTVFDRCSSRSCAQQPTDILCPNCYKEIPMEVNKNHEVKSVAHFQGCQPPVIPTESDSERKEREEQEFVEKTRRERAWKEEEVEYETRLDNKITERLRAERARIQEERRVDAARKPNKSWEDRKKEEIARDLREEEIVEEELAAATAEAMKEPDLNKRERRLEQIEAVREKHTL